VTELVDLLLLLLLQFDIRSFLSLHPSSILFTYVRYLPNMRFSIEKLLNAKKNLNYTKVGKAVPSWVEFKTFIHKMEIVMKKSMYGFYPKTVPFVKLSLLNPLDVGKVVSILEVLDCFVM
jgi:DNA polymerase family B, exonuclease domain